VGFNRLDVRGIGRDSVLTVETPMTSAQYILAYRVLECGLMTRPIESTTERGREGRVRLHLRLHDARTGVILAAQNVENVITDQINIRDEGWLRNYHYRYFPTDLPLQRGNVGAGVVGGGKSDGGSKSTGSTPR
jgi:hypothetical protein